MCSLPNSDLLTWMTFLSPYLFLCQQTEELQTSSSSTVRRSSSSGSSFNSSVIRRGSLNSSNISGGRASQAASDALSFAGTSKGSTVSGGRVKGSGNIGTGDKGRAGSLLTTVEGVSLIPSEKKLEEESRNGGVAVSSSSDVSSLNSVLGSSLSSSLDQFSGCPGTDGTSLKWPLCEVVSACLDVFCLWFLLIFMLAAKVGISRFFFLKSC